MEEFDKRKRAKIPIHSLPAPVEWLLKNATGQQLDYLDRMAKSEEFSVFLNLVGKFKHHTVYEIYGYMAQDADDLAYFRAGKVGQVAGLDALIIVCQSAGMEISRRKRLKEGEDGKSA